MINISIIKIIGWVGVKIDKKCIVLKIGSNHYFLSLNRFISKDRRIDKNFPLLFIKEILIIAPI